MIRPGSRGRRVLVAGVGNMFLGDDGFGPEVARRLAARDDLPDDVAVVDYGVGGIHLAYDVLDGCEVLVFVDATPRGKDPGSLVLLEVDAEEAAQPVQIDSHAMVPEAVLSAVTNLGGTPPRTFVVGCEPADTDERMGLTEPVEAAVDPAVDEVLQLTRRLVAKPADAPLEV